MLIATPIKVSLETSEWQCGENTKLNNIQEVQTWENTQALHANMFKTGEYLAKGFQEVLNFIEEANNKVMEYVYEANTRDRLLLEGQAEDGNLEIGFESQTMKAIAAQSNSNLQEVKVKMDTVESKMDGVNAKMDAVEAKLEKLEQKLDASVLDVRIEVVKKADPTTLMILTTLNGVPVEPSITITGFDEETEENVAISFESKALGDSSTTMYYKLTNNNHGSKILVVTAAYHSDADAEHADATKPVLERTELVSLGY